MTHVSPSRDDEAPSLLGAVPPPLGTVVRVIAVLTQVICVGSLATLFFALATNVFLRYAFKSGLGWAYDIHTVIFPWVIGSGAVLATIHGRHVAITLLRDNFSQEVGRIIYVTAQALVFIISIFVVWSSYPIVMAARFQKIYALGNISQIWGYLSITYAFVTIAILCVLDVIAIVRVHRDVRGDGNQSGLG